MIRALARRLGRAVTARLPGALRSEALRREDGTASMEFVLVIPVIMMIFMASFESALLMTRSIMLEQSVDMVMRELRLGHISPVTNARLKKEICDLTVVFSDCRTNMKIELERISTDNWTIPTAPTQCINRQGAAEPVITLDAGQQNDLMLVRVCVTLDAMFPGAGIALNMNLDPDGGYDLVATTAFAVEPS
jgi:Flp pilus assembly protein TadG